MTRLTPAKISVLFMVTCLFLGETELSSQQILQKPPPPPLRERIFFGGNFGLQLGTYTAIELSPVIGFWALPRVGLAIGPSFRYMKDPLGETDVYGGKAYARLVVVNDITNVIPIGIRLSLFLHCEVESLSFRSDWFTSSSLTPRLNVNTALAGFGISQPIGRRGSIDMAILFVVSYSGEEIYDNPVYRIGFTF